MAGPEKMPEQAAAEDKPAPPKFVERIGGAKRSETVTLEWPVEYDGKVWTEIEVRRMTASHIRDFYESLGDEDSKPARFPMFDAPDVVMDALDVDDEMKVQEVAQRFLPRRVTGAKEASGPTLEPGEAMSPSSAAT